MKKRILFIDRDGTILVEPPIDHQIDKIDKFAFVYGAITSLSNIKKHTDFEFVMVSNQDGLGTPLFPKEDFWMFQNIMVQTLCSVGVTFSDVLIDSSLESDNNPNRKPCIGLVQKYINDDNYDIAQSLVIGDRYTDVLFAKNLGCKAIYMGKDNLINDLIPHCLLHAKNWDEAERAVISYNTRDIHKTSF